MSLQEVMCMRKDNVIQIRINTKKKEQLQSIAKNLFNMDLTRFIETAIEKEVQKLDKTWHF